MDFLKVLLFIGAVQGLLMTIFLFSTKRNKAANKYLGILTLIWGFSCYMFAVQGYVFFTSNPHVYKITTNLTLLFFPPLFLYTKHLTSEIRRFQKRDLIHFLPFFISIILHLPFFISSGAEKIEIIKQGGTSYLNTLSTVIDQVIILQGILYTILALYLLRKHKVNILNNFSDIESIRLQWLIVLIALNLALWLVGSTGAILEAINKNIGVDLFVYFYLGVVIVIYTISFKALFQPEIFNHKNAYFVYKPHTEEIVGKKEAVILESEKIIPSKSDITSSPSIGLSNEKLEEYTQKLKVFIEEEKPYLNSQLKLQDLADELGLSRHELSYVINNKLQKNFYDLINEYRIEEVKRRIEDPKNKNLTLLALAYDSGFYSKATFNRAFKNITQMTPSAYLSQANLISQN